MRWVPAPAGRPEERGQREEGRGKKTGTIRPRGPCWPALRPFSLWPSFSGFFPLASVLFPFPFVLICPRNRVCVQSVSERSRVAERSGGLPTRAGAQTPPTPPSQGGEYGRRRRLVRLPPLRRGGWGGSDFSPLDVLNPIVRRSRISKSPRSATRKPPSGASAPIGLRDRFFKVTPARSADSARPASPRNSSSAGGQPQTKGRRGYFPGSFVIIGGGD